MQLWAGEGGGGPRTVTHLPALPTDTAGEDTPAPVGREPGPWATTARSCSFPTPPVLGALQVGEDVPDARKCACASHVAKVAEFFQVRVGAGPTTQGLFAGGGGDRREPCCLNTPSCCRAST